MRPLALICWSTLLVFGCSRQETTPISIPGYGPPQPLIDQIAPCPGPDDSWTWQPGYYVWTGTHYTWQQGEWVNRPAPEARWKPGMWLPRTYGWTFVPGYWY